MKEILNQQWSFLTAIIISVLILFAQITYWISLYNRKVKPSYLSWVGWAIFMGISFIGQLLSKGWTIKMIALLISTIGCFIIGLSARFVFKYFSYKKEDMKFLYLGLVCILIYLLFKDVWLTTIIAIIADLLLAFPTIKSAYKKPMDEKSSAWILAFVSWGLTLILVLNNFFWLHMLWPLYLITFNGLMIILTYIRPQLQKTNR